MTRLLGALGRWVVRHARAVLAAWVLLAALLSLALPQLESVVGRDTTPFLPARAESLRAVAVMDHAFDGHGTRALVFVVVRDPHGVSRDAAWLQGVVHQLQADREHVALVQPAVSSPDGTVSYLTVGVRHPLGSPRTDADVRWLRDRVAEVPAGAAAVVTGDAAVYDDADEAVQRSLLVVSAASSVIILLLLFGLYRSRWAPVVPLATIGVSLVVARGVLSALGGSVMTVSTYTGLFVMALVMGAGTDYSVFLLSRYHEARNDWISSDDAAVEAVTRVGPVVLASGSTVALATASLGFAGLSLFRTTGPAMAVAVLVTMAASLTLTPALIALVGPRTVARLTTTWRWKQTSRLVARHPARLLAASTALLLVMAAAWVGAHPEYDNRQLVPTSSDSRTGYRLVAEHLGAGQLQPDFLVVQSPELATAPGRAALLSAAQAVAQVPGVVSVLPSGSLTTAFIGSDHRTARILVYGDGLRSQVAAEKAALRAALGTGPLHDARVLATGGNAGRDDVRRYAQADLRLVATIALLTILLVLVMLLRSVVAPVCLLLTVVLSYAATVGVTYVLFHDVLGRPLDFTVPLLSFVILVAVGADDNIMLMSRLREESPEASREGVARALSSTGKVITSAGLIFAGSFVGMVGSSIVGLAETGFAVAFGVLLDTFVVRTLVVPSLAALLGPKVWWPRRPAAPPFDPPEPLDVRYASLVVTAGS